MQCDGIAEERLRIHGHHAQWLHVQGLLLDRIQHTRGAVVLPFRSRCVPLNNAKLFAGDLCGSPKFDSLSQNNLLWKDHVAMAKYFVLSDACAYLQMQHRRMIAVQCP